MDQGNPPHPPASRTQLPATSEPHHAESSIVTGSPSLLDRLALLQRAYLLEQLALPGAESKSVGELNKMPESIKRELQLTPGAANRIRGELVDQRYLEVRKDGRKVSYALSEAGRTYLAGLERPAVSARTKQSPPVDEATISDEVREAQKAYLLLQLLGADGRTMTRGEANKIPTGLRASLGLKPPIANYRRTKLVEQGFVCVTSNANSEQYTLTPDGLDYLAASDRHLGHAEFRLKGNTLNALAAARGSLFERDPNASRGMVERPMPSQEELEEAVLAEFRELKREQHSYSGLVPIHEVRQRIADRFGLAAARHDVLDEVILGLWRQKRLGLEGISDLGKATHQQLNDGIPGVSGTIFYLEAPREQPVAP